LNRSASPILRAFSVAAACTAMFAVLVGATGATAQEAVPAAPSPVAALEGPP
jgi:hypothetical protein